MVAIPPPYTYRYAFRNHSFGGPYHYRLYIRVRHRGAVPPGLKKSNLAEFSQGETEKSDLNPEFRGAGVEAG